jgi:tetratricopeptide (TPR) repeat protein
MRYKIPFFLIIAGIMLASCNPQGKENNLENSDSQTVSKVDELTLLIREDSNDAVLFQQRALAHLSNNNHNMAMRDMLQAIQIDPDNAKYMLTLSDIYMSMGLMENCVESLDRALRLEPENVESMLKLAEINLILKKYKESIEYVDMAIKIDKINPLPYFIKGYTPIF